MNKHWIFIFIMVASFCYNKSSAMSVVMDSTERSEGHVVRIRKGIFEYDEGFVHFHAGKLGLISPLSSKRLPILSEELIRDQFAKRQSEMFESKPKHQHERVLLELIMARDYLLGFIYADWLGVIDARDAEAIKNQFRVKLVTLIRDSLDGVYSLALFNLSWDYTIRAKDFLLAQADLCTSDS